jgi:transport family protein 27
MPYPKNYIMTLGIDFCVKVIQIPDTEYSVELYLFDTSGSDIYQPIRANYWAGVDSVMVVYDVSSRESFSRTQSWVQELQAALPNTRLSGVMVAAKSDLQEYSEVSLDDAKQKAEQLKLQFFQTSALNNKNVDAPFLWLANNTYQQYMTTVKKLIGK